MPLAPIDFEQKNPTFCIGSGRMANRFYGWLDKADYEDSGMWCYISFMNHINPYTFKNKNMGPTGNTAPENSPINFIYPNASLVPLSVQFAGNTMAGWTWDDADIDEEYIFSFRNRINDFPIHNWIFSDPLNPDSVYFSTGYRLYCRIKCIDFQGNYHYVNAEPLFANQDDVFILDNIYKQDSTYYRLGMNIPPFLYPNQKQEAPSIQTGFIEIKDSYCQYAYSNIPMIMATLEDLRLKVDEVYVNVLLNDPIKWLDADTSKSVDIRVRGLFTSDEANKKRFWADDNLSVWPEEYKPPIYDTDVTNRKIYYDGVVSPYGIDWTSMVCTIKSYPFFKQKSGSVNADNPTGTFGHSGLKKDNYYGVFRWSYIEELRRAIMRIIQNWWGGELGNPDSSRLLSYFLADTDIPYWHKSAASFIKKVYCSGRGMRRRTYSFYPTGIPISYSLAKDSENITLVSGNGWVFQGDDSKIFVPGNDYGLPPITEWTPGLLSGLAIFVGANIPLNYIYNDYDGYLTSQVEHWYSMAKKFELDGEGNDENYIFCSGVFNWIKDILSREPEWNIYNITDSGGASSAGPEAYNKEETFTYREPDPMLFVSHGDIISKTLISTGPAPTYYRTWEVKISYNGRVMPYKYRLPEFRVWLAYNKNTISWTDWNYKMYKYDSGNEWDFSGILSTYKSDGNKQMTLPTYWQSFNDELETEKLLHYGFNDGFWGEYNLITPNPAKVKDSRWLPNAASRFIGPRPIWFEELYLALNAIWNKKVPIIYNLELDTIGTVYGATHTAFLNYSTIQIKTHNFESILTSETAEWKYITHTGMGAVDVKRSYFIGGFGNADLLWVADRDRRKEPAPLVSGWRASWAKHCMWGAGRYFNKGIPNFEQEITGGFMLPNWRGQVLQNDWADSVL